MNTPQAVAKPKNAPNLTSVTPASPPPAPPEMDTTTPIDVSVLAFTQADLPKWGPWVLYRLQQHWTQFSPMSYIGLLTQAMNDRATLFIRSKKAILLAVLTRETFDPRPIADIVFAFKFHPDEEAENKDMRVLFRQVDDWAASAGAKYIRIRHLKRVDLNYTKAKEILRGEKAEFLLRDLDT